MDSKVIHSFLLIADTGNITKAAHLLHYAQSTLSAQMQQLEREVGFPLFDRIGNNIKLTNFGVAFYSYARQIDNIVEQISTIQTDPDKISGKLNIGVAESLLLSSVIDIIPRYRTIYPQIEIQLKSGPSVAFIVDSLKQNIFDLVYVSHNLNRDPQLTCHYKRKESIIFVTQPSHPLASQKKIPLKHLFSFLFIGMERTGYLNQQLEHLARKVGATPQFSVIVENLTVVLKILKNYGGIALLPVYSVRDELSEGSLVTTDVDMPPQEYYSQVLMNAKKWISPYAAAFIELIKEYAPER